MTQLRPTVLHHRQVVMIQTSASDFVLKALQMFLLLIQYNFTPHPAKLFRSHKILPSASYTQTSCKAKT